MPISLLIALLIAFGMDLPGPEVSARSVPLRLLEAAGGVLADRAPGLRAGRLGGVAGRAFRLCARAGCAGATPGRPGC